MKRRPLSFQSVFHWIVLISTIGLFLLAAFVYWQCSEDVHRSGSYISMKHSQKQVMIYTATPFFDVPITNSVLKRCPPDVQKMLSFIKQFKRNCTVPYVLLALESPFYAWLHPYKHFFNWTMTYRMDSDVYFPYGGLVRRKKVMKIDYEEIWSSKNRMALWLVSNQVNTGNKRKELVEKMVKEGLDVDLFGALYRVPPGCPRVGQNEECEMELHRPYKFTIAFENNNCKNYVTEKFWRKVVRYQMVPIVMKRKTYRDIGIPDLMYIAVDDFGTLKELVSHIKKASANKTAYLEYHKWREEFRIVDTNEENFGYCNLCRKLLNFNGNPKKSYENMAKWFNESLCDNSFADRYL